MSCSICIESFNKSNRVKITCPICNFESCRICCERYMTEDNVEGCHCMNCKKTWTHKFLADNFTYKFLNGKYKEYKKSKLFEREVSMLPAAQLKLEKNKEMNIIRQKMLNVEDEIYLLRNKYNRFKMELDNFDSLHRNTEHKFIKKCSNENCRGFLSSKWKCGLCEKYTCSKCHEIKEDEHKCNSETVESVKFLSNDTKPCPSCGTLIFKIDGCDQMWCTQCNTAFSWITGNKINGTLHNPHYFEWLRRAGNNERNILDIRCGREIDPYFVIRIKDLEISEIARKIIHLRHVELPRYITNDDDINEPLRISFLNNEIDEKKFKNLIHQRDKSKNKKRDILNIIRTVIDGATEILYRLESETTGLNRLYINTNDTYEKYKMELKNLEKYANECLEDISNIYKSTKYELQNYTLKRK